MRVAFNLGFFDQVLQGPAVVRAWYSIAAGIARKTRLATAFPLRDGNR
jgi:hypothetical protein